LVTLNLDLTWKGFLIAIPIALVVLGASWAGMETYTSRSSFCGGSCHTMTEQYVAWQNDTHNASKNPEGIQANCIDCHFLPGEKYGFKAKYEGLRHLFAYLYDRDAPLPFRPVVKDGACLRSGCHDAGQSTPRLLHPSPSLSSREHHHRFSGAGTTGNRSAG
jgi:hypothetical protein